LKLFLLLLLLLLLKLTLLEEVLSLLELKLQLTLMLLSLDPTLDLTSSLGLPVVVKNILETDWIKVHNNDLFLLFLLVIRQILVVQELLAV